MCCDCYPQFKTLGFSSKNTDRKCLRVTPWPGASIALDFRWVDQMDQEKGLHILGAVPATGSRLGKAYTETDSVTDDQRR